MPLPLEGYRILELAMMAAVPYGVRDLADMGAEVIKIEDPGIGDRSRHTATPSNANFFPACSYSYFFESANRGKRSVALNLRAEEGRATFYRLVPHCDVLVTSLRMGSLKRMGLDYAAVSRYNPAIIYVHLNTYGPKGDDAELPGVDVAAQARGGFLNMMRATVEGEPATAGVYGAADMTSSIQVAYAICVALLARERTGLGQEVNVSLIGAMLTAGELLLEGCLSTGKDPQPPERASILNPTRSLYRCRDGKWIYLAMTESEHFWESFCRVIGEPAIAQDARFCDDARRAENHRELISILDGVFLTRTREEWYQSFKEHDCPAAKVQSYREVAEDPQAVENEYITTLNHPVHGPMRTLGVMVNLSRTPGRVGGPAPEVGQHTEEVLTSLAGYSPEQVRDLVRVGVAACA